MAMKQNPDRKYDDKQKKLTADAAAALARAQEQADLDKAEKARIKSAQSVNKREEIEMGAAALKRAQGQKALDDAEKAKIRAAKEVMTAATNAGWVGGAVNNPDGDPTVDSTDRNPASGPIPVNPYIATPKDPDPVELDPDFDGTITALTAMLAKYDMVGIVAEIKRIRKKFPQIKSDDIITMIQFDSEYNKPYLARFAGNAELMKKGKRTLTMGEYLSNEQAYEKVFKAYDVKNLSDRTSYARLIAGEVSPEEAGDRVNLGYTRVLGDKDTLESFKKYYPQLTTGDIIGAMLDPENQLPALQKKVTAAEIGGAAVSRAFAISEEEAMNLGSAYGVDKAEAQKGFSDIGLMSELGQVLPGDISGAVTSNEMLGLTFKEDAEAKKKLRKVATTRTAEFEAGGEFAASQTGVSGLGTATRGT
jgi:hypothetical protein